MFRSNWSFSEIIEQRELLVLRVVQFGVDGLLEFQQDGPDVVGFLVGSLAQLLLEAAGAVLHAGFERLSQRRGEVVPQFEQVLLHRLVGFVVRGRGQQLVQLADVQTGEAAFLEHSARRDDLFVQPVTVAADHDQPGMSDDRRRIENVIRHEPGRDAVQPLAALDRPDFRTQQPQAHLDEPVVQVDQHDVVPAIGGGVIEGDRANVLGVGMLQALGTRRPTVLQGGQREDRLAGLMLGSEPGQAARPAPDRPRPPCGYSPATAAVPVAFPDTVRASSLICFAKSRSNLSIFRTGSTLVSARLTPGIE